MTRSRELYNNIDARLRVIRGLAVILMDNDCFKTEATAHASAQLDAENEMSIHEAVHLLSDQAQHELIELVDLLGGTPA